MLPLLGQYICLFVLVLFYLNVCMYACILNACLVALEGQERELNPPRTGVVGGCELFYVGAGNWTRYSARAAKALIQ